MILFFSSALPHLLSRHWADTGISIWETGNTGPASSSEPVRLLPQSGPYDSITQTELAKPSLSGDGNVALPLYTKPEVEMSDQKYSLLHISLSNFMSVSKLDLNWGHSTPEPMLFNIYTFSHIVIATTLFVNHSAKHKTTFLMNTKVKISGVWKTYQIID